MMNEYVINQNEDESDLEEMEYVGFFARFWASGFDEIILLYFTYVAAWFLHSETDANLGEMIGFMYPAAGLGLLDLAAAIVYIMGFWVVRQATPGKMIIACRVVDAETGKRPGFLQYLLRLVGYIVSVLPLFLGFLWIIFDDRKQGFHDKIAGTVVIKNPPWNQ